MYQNSNIKVVCRVRPLNSKQKQDDTNLSLQITANQIQLINTPHQSTFSFDYVFGPSSQQLEFYQTVAAPQIGYIFQGLNLTIFAYGQTSSGKTYTMQGYGQNIGLVPRMMQQIFKRVTYIPPHIQFRLKVSVIQIYLEKIKDLLKPSSIDLKIRQSKSLGIFIQGVTQAYVSQYNEVLKLIDLANNHRTVSATGMNQTSSRSHLLLSLTLYQNDLQDMSAKSSRVFLVDLAGSQKVAKTGAQGKLLQQAKGINKSLSALGNVINALIQKSKGSHIPYRDSKLTRILQQSLGGNSKTLLIITCSPASINSSQSLSTLRFGSRAKKIKNNPKINRQYTVQQLLVLLQKSQLKIKQQQVLIKQLNSHNSGKQFLCQKCKKLKQQQVQFKQTKTLQQHNIFLKQLSSPTLILDKVAKLQLQQEQDRQNDNSQLSQKELINQLYKKISVLQNDIIKAQRVLQIERMKKQQFIAQSQNLICSLNEKQALIQQQIIAINSSCMQLQKANDKIDELKAKVSILQSFKKQIQQNGSFMKNNKKQTITLQISIQQLEKTINKLGRQNKEKTKSVQALLQKIQKFNNFIFGQQAQSINRQMKELFMDNQKLRIQDSIIKDFQKRQNEFIKQKDKLFSDLKDRIQKVLDLQQKLDYQKDKNICIEQCLRKDKIGQKLYQAQQSNIQLNQKYLSLKAKQCLWKNQNNLQKNRLKMKDDRIKQLQEKLIKSKLQLNSVYKTKTDIKSKRKTIAQQTVNSNNAMLNKRMVKVFSSLRFPQLSD